LLPKPRPLLLPVLAPALFACGARTPLLVNEEVGGAPGESADSGVPPMHAKPADKIDLLFMIDNSASMIDKQELLRQAVPDLLNRLVNPKCVDPSNPNVVVGTSNGGECASGMLEFPVVHDIHVGIVTSSLGGRGSDACPEGMPSHDNPSLPAHNDDHGRLINRGGADEHTVADALPSNFLAWFPSDANAPPSVTPLRDPARFARDFQDLVEGVHESGCGFEAQMESWYRFLIQPDPFLTIETDGTLASLVGTDDVLLGQRRDFLRPDSLVAVILLTDENDSTVDPMSLDRTGWIWESIVWPGSPTGRPPRATSACATNPEDPACASCQGARGGDPSCATGGGYYTADEEKANERFFHMKQRFGVDPQFPIDRYVRALTNAKVPDRNGKDADNPLFVGNQRALDLVYFAFIGGVPNQLLHFDPASLEQSRLSPDDWLRILGRDPLHYDFTGADPHMLESLDPRPGLPGPGSPNNADPISGRDFVTNKNDLEYACTFPLATPRDCSTPKLACDCAPGRNTPLCDSNTPTLQVRGKAYPGIRELSVARELGDQAIVASLCAIHSVPDSPDDPLYGYRPAMTAIVDRLKQGLK
jgi:hypothetical protein